MAKALVFSLRGYRTSPAEALGGALFTEAALHTSASTATLRCDPDEGAALSEASSDDSEAVFDVGGHPLVGAPAAAGAAGRGGAAPASGGCGLVVVRHIDVFSTSDADLQPFFGRVHVGYLPAGGRIVGLSKAARIAEVFARRLQNPQALCDDIAVRIPNA